MRAALLALVVVATAVYAAPMGVEDTLKALQEQIATMEKAMVNNAINKEKEVSFPSLEDPRQQQWQPAKRMVAWQPMKRNVDERAPLVHAIEARLSEVLRAGERLGVSAEEVLADLRYRNQLN